MSEKAHRAAIIALFVRGNSPSEIIRVLKLGRNNRSTVYRIIHNYRKTHSIERIRTSRLSVKRKKITKNLRDKIRRNPVRSQRQLAKEYNTSQRTIGRILRDDLHLRALKTKRNKLYPAGGKDARVQRTVAMKRRLAAFDPRCVIFSDEKIFTVEQCFNSQNRRVYSPSVSAADPSKLYVPHSQKPESVMVFAAISGFGVSDLKFVDPGVKINQHFYTDSILRDCVLPWVRRTFPDKPYIFQQDGAPSHTSRRAQAFCSDNFYDFLRKEEWPAASPDLNPCDFFLWGHLQEQVNNKTYASVEHLKVALTRAWQKLDLKLVESACVEAFQKRMRLLIKEKGFPFEHLL